METEWARELRTGVVGGETVTLRNMDGCPDHVRTKTEILLFCFRLLLLYPRVNNNNRTTMINDSSFTARAKKSRHPCALIRNSLVKEERGCRQLYNKDVISLFEY